MIRRMHISKDVLKTLDSYGGMSGRPDPQGRTIVPGAKQPEDTPEAKPETKPVDSLSIAWRSDQGKVRTSNQDAVIMQDNLVGVADGMGGHKGGEVASAGLRDSLQQQLANREADPQVLASAVRNANRRLYMQSQDDENLRGMGTTLDVLWFGGKAVYCAHVGDSRVYLLREGQLRQVTQDHSMVMEMYRAGIITLEQAEHHPMKNIITRAVGTENHV